MKKIIKRDFQLKTFSRLGSASGEDEADYIPDFHKFFFDEEGHASDILDPRIFFVLGRKGAGKTFLARYVASEAMRQRDAYRKAVEVQSFRNFPFHKLGQFKDDAFRDKEYFEIWRWLLLITIAKQLIKDEGIEGNDHNVTLRRLIEEHFSSKLTFTEIVERTSSLRLSGGIKDYLSVESKNEKKERPKNPVGDSSALEDLVINSFTGSSFETIVFLDDLDDGFEDTELYEQALGSLIYATDQVNRRLHRAGIRAKIILLLRTDIFRAINTADLNKFKAGNSLILDWDIEEGENSSLLRMLVHRLIVALDVKISSNQYAEAFYELFDNRIENHRTAEWLINLTLARPRDLTQIVKLACQACPKHSVFSGYALLQAKPKYSQFLYDDIRNEMKGHKSREFIDETLSLLKGVPAKGTFSLEKLKEKKRHLFQTQEGEQKVKDMLSFLYKFSAIGNIYHNPEDRTSISYFSWAHREDQPEPDFDAPFSVHLGLRHALKAGSDVG